MQFRKRPIVVEAVQFNPNADNTFDLSGRGEMPDGVRRTSYLEVSELCGGTSGCSRTPEMWDWQVCGVVETLEGKHLALPGDWIITGVKGERYPCKPDIFAATYEPAE